ncbi:MAG: hypothetical protein JXM69_03970 [Anaerolineae bacterium]|nr:hypothetical protein [Anaerolineae bacterium]
MNKHHLWLTTGLATFFTLTIMIGSLLVFGGVVAAPLAQVSTTPTPQVVTTIVTDLSVSAMAFVPVNPDASFEKDTGRQMLTFARNSVGVATDDNIFIAPLFLPNETILTGLTVFGEDFDTQGAVQLRLKRCDHGQARCVSLVETTSTPDYAAGQFETLKAAIPNEVVDNYFYNYFLELELTALAGSGLRSVRLEMRTNTVLTTGEGVQKWSLTGNVTNFLLPNQGVTQARICTDDLGHLDNLTHYPELVVDGHTISLSSNTCVTVLGYNMQIRRNLNVGPSSGTYQFLN